MIDQAPVLSLSLWTFKGTIWHPEQAIDERQLTPVASSRQQVDGPTWGTVGWRAPVTRSALLARRATRGRAVGHQFTFLLSH